MRVHVDTDLGGNPDDAAALAMLLGWEGVEVVGVTTVDDGSGRRLRTTRWLLDRVQNGDRVPVARGGTDAALSLLASGAATGATLLALGPCTNLAALERSSAGALDGVRVTVMGGWAIPMPPGFPPWRPRRDRNIRRDVPAVLGVFESGATLTLVPCGVAATGTLRGSDLPELAATGPVGRRLVRDSVAHAQRRGHGLLAWTYPALPDDLVNFHWDPVAAATAVGWDGCVVVERRLTPRPLDTSLVFDEDPTGRRTRVVTAVDGDRFREVWIGAVRRAQAAPPG